MKSLFALTASVALFFSGIVGLTNTHKPTVTSLRAFEEPLVALGGDAATDQDAALISAIQQFQNRKTYDDVSPLTQYLDANAQSPWKFSLLANLGIIYRKTGHFSKAVDAWEQAWALGKGEKHDVRIQGLATRVAGELSSLVSSLGRTERLAPLLAEIKGRPLYGSASAALMYSSENLSDMKKKPGDSFKCGPYALGSILTFQNAHGLKDNVVMTAKSSSKGFSLTEVRDLSVKLKMNYQMAKRLPGAEFIIPSVAHWKSGHYAALLQKDGDRYLTKDPTFGQQILVTPQALEEESSGYFLVPSGPLPNGWEPVTDTEGDTVWGRGKPALTPPACTNCYQMAGAGEGGCGSCGGSGGPASGGISNGGDFSSPNRAIGMARYDILMMLVSLRVSDVPVGYTPPVGPDVHCEVTYNELEYGQPSTFSYFNFGPSWNCGWLSFVAIPTSTGATLTLYTRGGGQEIYNATTYVSAVGGGYLGYYANQIQGQSTLWVKAPVAPSTYNTYEHRFPDGSEDVYTQVDTSGRVFLTSIVDSKGNALTLAYDSSFRLASVTDALGLVTTLTYPTTGDVLKVIKVTDPYGRYATFNYSTTAPYQLISITDVVGITSSFTYGSGSAMSELTTPYGNTFFSFSWDGNYTAPNTRTLTVTEPDSGQVKVEFDDGPNYPYVASGTTLVTSGAPGSTSEPIPVWTDSGTSGHYGISSPAAGQYIQYRNTYFWNKKAMQDGPTDYTKARILHWLHTQDGTSVSPVLESEKPALENRIWYTYPGQTGYVYGYVAASIVNGSSELPNAVLRVISDPYNPQKSLFQYNNSTNPAALTAKIDPLGRQTNYSYASNGIDLTGISQINGTGTATLATLTYTPTGTVTPPPPHCPVTVTDAAGQTTAYTYNGQGQVTSIMPPVRSGHSAETTTYNYTGNFLTSIARPMSGATTTLTYDTLGGHTLGRVKTVSDSESYTLTYTYDNLDRVTQISFPDSTSETFSYLNPTSSQVDLDLHTSIDRLGRTTSRNYDSVRHLISMTDPLSRTTHYGYCPCGALTSLTDPKGNITYFNYDTESRLTSKVYPGGTQPPASPDDTYDVIGRLSTFTDKRGNVTTYSYNVDDTVSSLNYSVVSGTAATPNVSYTYDSAYPRVTLAGGVSTTYYAAGALGAEKPHVVTNTMSGGSGTAAITYTYDEWGRVVGRNIDGANSQTTAFDGLGRETSVANVLGTFNYTYFDNAHPTNRVGSISYPNGQSTVYNYFGNTGNERLSEINNLTPGSAALSKFDYTYDAIGKIQTLQQQTDASTPLVWTYGYDAADQLTSAVLTNTTITSPAVRSDSYGYDLAGNPTTFNVGGVSRSPTYNALNWLTGSTPSGNRIMGFTGALHSPATVTVNGSAATVNSGNDFSGTASLTPGSTSTVAVVATDSHGNSRSNNYQVVVPSEPTYAPTYDADGNELTNGAGQAYTWDAKNELILIAYTGGASTSFAYDALGRRTSIVESSGITRQLVWDGALLAEERNGSNTVTKRFFALGEQISGSSYYYSFDHLGSIREMTNSTGIILARYDYDPYGRATKTGGSMESDLQYTGYYRHSPSGLNLTRYRVYDPNIAKWLSRDPIGEVGGINLYGYVGDNPITRIDPQGRFYIIAGAVIVGGVGLYLLYKELYKDFKPLDQMHIDEAKILTDPNNMAQHCHDVKEDADKARDGIIKAQRDIAMKTIEIYLPGATVDDELTNLLQDDVYDAAVVTLNSSDSSMQDK